jgi:hypothetical protein
MTPVGQEGTSSGHNSQCIQRVGLGPTSPWCRLPRVCLGGHTVGGLNTIPLKWGKVSSNSMRHEATKFAGPHKSYMHWYIIRCLLIRAQPTRALIITSGGYHLRAPNLWSRPISSFPSSIRCLLIRAQPTRALIITGGGYHLRAPNLWSRPVSSFPSSMLHFLLIVLLCLQLCQHLDHLAKSI